MTLQKMKTQLFLHSEQNEFFIQNKFLKEIVPYQ